MGTEAPSQWIAGSLHGAAQKKHGCPSAVYATPWSSGTGDVRLIRGTLWCSSPAASTSPLGDERQHAVHRRDVRLNRDHDLVVRDVGEQCRGEPAEAPGQATAVVFDLVDRAAEG